MRIRADFGVGHAAPDVWALLSSGAGAECVPGLSLGTAGEGQLEMDVEARHLVFDGTADVASDEPARTVTAEIRGTERSGLGKARAIVMLRVEEDGLFSTVNAEADLHLTGQLSSMARLLAESAYRLADGLADRLDANLGAGSRPPAPTPEPVSSATPDRGWWRRLLDRLGGD